MQRRIVPPTPPSSLLAFIPESVILHKRRNLPFVFDFELKANLSQRIWKRNRQTCHPIEIPFPHPISHPLISLEFAFHFCLQRFSAQSSRDIWNNERFRDRA
ncbi:hypothetical protein F2P81_013696 [Scophthalmus maximus]|uniref:Uncharacterized protein n=1 Tax=Scophthalmus maximus TaxID=52904 RepID=A0A6A4SNY2_SCOMX|nr:hypothetical protein F2P81_013696 [Scophthalmus maximus]